MEQAQPTAHSIRPVQGKATHATHIHRDGQCSCGRTIVRRYKAPLSEKMKTGFSHAFLLLPTAIAANPMCGALAGFTPTPLVAHDLGRTSSNVEISLDWNRRSSSSSVHTMPTAIYTHDTNTSRNNRSRPHMLKTLQNLPALSLPLPPSLRPNYNAPTSPTSPPS